MKKSTRKSNPSVHGIFAPAVRLTPFGAVLASGAVALAGGAIIAVVRALI